MDSNLSADCMMDFEVNSLQNQDDNNEPSLSNEDGPSAKRFKEELDPLKIASVLEKIFINLDVDSIKNARQVNPLWGIEGAKILMTKCYIKIPSNLQVQEVSRNNKEMDKFKAFLSHKLSDQSMISNIIIDKINDAELWKSLGVLGKQVESLKLNYFRFEECWLHGLLNLLPNLKHIRLTEHYPFWNEKGYIIMKVLTSVMSSFETDRSPLVIPFVYPIIENVEQLENMEKLADCRNILIEALHLTMSISFFRALNPDVSVRVSNLIKKLLSTSQHIFKKLSLSNCMLFLHLIEFPRMPALTLLELNSCYEAPEHLLLMKFSPSFKFSESVPNLSRIKFDLFNGISPQASDDFLVRLFGQAGVASSVKSLKYTHMSMDLDIHPLWKTFPNIEKLDTTVGSQEMMESIWKYGENLRKLYLFINLDDCIETVANLDSIFTGFTPETVDEIKKTPNLDSYTLEEIEELRVNPSILNLKNLECLTICILGASENHLPSRFLAVAGEYGFKYMSKYLMIFIEVAVNCSQAKYDRTALDEVSKLPNVYVVPEGQDHSEEENE